MHIATTYYKHIFFSKNKSYSEITSPGAPPPDICIIYSDVLVVLLSKFIAYLDLDQALQNVSQTIQLYFERGGLKMQSLISAIFTGRAEEQGGGGQRFCFSTCVKTE